MLVPSQESRSWRVRVVRLPVAHPDALVAVVDVDRRAFYAEVSKQAEAVKAVFDSAGLVYPDAFVGFEIMSADCSVASVLAGLHRVTSSVSSGVCEVRSRRFSHKCVRAFHRSSCVGHSASRLRCGPSFTKRLW